MAGNDQNSSQPEALVSVQPPEPSQSVQPEVVPPKAPEAPISSSEPISSEAQNESKTAVASISAGRDQLRQLRGDTSKAKDAIDAQRRGLSANMATLIKKPESLDAWTGKNPEFSMISMVDSVSDQIGPKVEKSLEKNKDILEAAGLNDPKGENLKFLKLALTTVAREYFSKGGTEASAEKELEPKLLNLLKKLKDIFEQKDANGKPKYNFPNQKSFLTEFSKFTQTNFLEESGFINPDNLMQVLKMTPETYDLMVKAFQEDLDLKTGRIKIDTDEMNAAVAAKTEQATPLDIAAELKSGRNLITETRITLPAGTSETFTPEIELKLKMEIAKTLAPDLNLQIQVATLDYLLPKLESLIQSEKLKPGNIIKLAGNGEFAKVDTTAEEKKAAEVAATIADTTQGPNKVVDILVGLGMGEGIAKFIEMLQGFFDMVGLNFNLDKYADMFQGELPPEFLEYFKEWKNSTESEKKEAFRMMKELMNKPYEIPFDNANMGTLLKNSEQTRLVLKAKTDSKKSWAAFIKIELAEQETNKIKSTETLSAEDVAKFFLHRPNAPKSNEPKAPAGPAIASADTKPPETQTAPTAAPSQTPAAPAATQSTPPPASSDSAPA